MGCPGGMSPIPYARINIYARFSEVVMGKNDRCAVFGFNNDRLLPRGIYNEVLFLPEKRA